MRKYWKVIINITQADIETENNTVAHNHITTLAEAEALAAGYEEKGDVAAVWIESFIE